ncbi:MoaD/ThiS family protein [Pseudonocardia humida]|uniref:Molybdopterin synthase sulfur carrier subunit n=1 Tax=Pseudonocardia humida TaxID=2800819 RepID=A0ABT1A1N0_9PSEU|nr:MoaD/ThiS family protein [Pseudonocardia humida]MCO1656825.1 MoaD/ThiS family protein [Pseudonocardia humida]
MTVVVRYFAAARAAAGVEEEKVRVGAGASIADLLDAVRAEHGAELAEVLDRCSYLLDEVAARDLSAALHDGATLDVLPPFAGG